MLVDIVATPVTDAVAVEAPETAKSVVSTFCTGSLNVTLNVGVLSFVVAAGGLLLTIEVTVGADESMVYVSSAPAEARSVSALVKVSVMS